MSRCEKILVDFKNYWQERQESRPYIPLLCLIEVSLLPSPDNYSAFDQRQSQAPIVNKISGKKCTKNW